MTIIFYYGEVWFNYFYANEFIDYDYNNCHTVRIEAKAGPSRWREEHFFCEIDPTKPTQKLIAFTFVYQTFFMM